MYLGEDPNVVVHTDVSVGYPTNGRIQGGFIMFLAAGESGALRESEELCVATLHLRRGP